MYQRTCRIKRDETKRLTKPGTSGAIGLDTAACHRNTTHVKNCYQSPHSRDTADIAPAISSHSSSAAPPAAWPACRHGRENPRGQGIPRVWVHWHTRFLILDFPTQGEKVKNLSMRKLPSLVLNASHRARRCLWRSLPQVAVYFTGEARAL